MKSDPRAFMFGRSLASSIFRGHSDPTAKLGNVRSFHLRASGWCLAAGLYVGGGSLGHDIAGTHLYHALAGLQSVGRGLKR